MFDFKEEKVQWNELLGFGSFGKVYPYQNDKDDRSWVVKVIKTNGDRELMKTIQEIVLGFSCNHPGIVPIKGFFMKKMESGDYEVYLRLPRMVETLRQKVDRDVELEKFYTEEQVIKYFYSLVCSVEYLHNQKNIAHRNINPVNIAFSQEGEIQLCDIGRARFIIKEELDEIEQEKVGTLAYTAPEVGKMSSSLKKKDLFKADAWSLGLVMAELCLKQKQIYNFKEVSVEKREKELVEKVNGLKGKYSEQLISLLIGLLDFNPEKRMSIEEAKQLLDKNDHMVPNQAQEIINSISTASANLEEVQENFNKIEQNHENLFQILKDAKAGLSFEELVIKCHKTISEDEVQSLSKQIGKNFKSLRHLSLNFSRCEKITDNSIQNLAKRIGKNLKSLEHLSLSFIFCNNITDKGVQNVSEHIGPNLKSLQQLNLYFSCCDKITDIGVESLAESIGSNLKSLQHLSLVFSWNNRITVSGVKSLAKQIKNNLHSLKHLYFQTDCFRFESVSSLVNWLSKS